MKRDPRRQLPGFQRDSRAAQVKNISAYREGQGPIANNRPTGPSPGGRGDQQRREEQLNHAARNDEGPGVRQKSGHDAHEIIKPDEVDQSGEEIHETHGAQAGFP